MQGVKQGVADAAITAAVRADAQAPEVQDDAWDDTCDSGDHQIGLKEDPARVLGDVAWLMANCDTYGNLTLKEFKQAVRPPIELRQYRLYRKGNVPIAFVTWALLNEAGAERVKGGLRPTNPELWQCGEDVYLMDIVTPYGARKAVLQDVRNRLFPDREVITLRGEC